MRSTPALLLTLLALAPAGRARASRLEQLRLEQGPDRHGTIREAGYEHPHGFVKLETPGKIRLVVLAPPHAWRIAAMRGDTSTKRPKSRIYTNLMTPLSHSR
jgi:hypothetical protein